MTFPCVTASGDLVKVPMNAHWGLQAWIGVKRHGKHIPSALCVGDKWFLFIPGLSASFKPQVQSFTYSTSSLIDTSKWSEWPQTLVQVILTLNWGALITPEATQLAQNQSSPPASFWTTPLSNWYRWPKPVTRVLPLKYCWELGPGAASRWWCRFCSVWWRTICSPA